MQPVMAPHTASRFTRFGQCEFSYTDEDENDLSGLHVRLIKSSLRNTPRLSHGRGHLSFSKTGTDPTTLLLDLARLAPAVAKDFIPKSHAEDTVPLRLLVDRDFQGEESGYIAVSYCRKHVTSESPGRVVTPPVALPFAWTKEVEQFPLPTSNEMFQAILRERREGEGLWFDQACINLEDETERIASFGCIDVIYQNARTVVIALDDVVVTPVEEHAVRDYAEQYSFLDSSARQQPNRGLSPPFMHQRPVLWSFVERMLNSACFDQADCAHEMDSARDLVFIVRCPSRGYEHPAVMRLTGAFVLHLLVLTCEVLTTHSTNYDKIRSLHTSLQQKTSLQKKATLAVREPGSWDNDAAQGRSFLSTIVDTFRLQASGNPSLPEYLRRLDANREKMAIALNASDLPLARTAANTLSRPNLEDECLRTSLLVALAARDPVALCTTGTFLQLHDGSTSWLNRPTALNTNSSRASPQSFTKGTYDIMQGSDGRAEYAQLGLVFLELPHRAQPNRHFPAQVARARIVVDLCIQYQLQGSALWDMWQTPGHVRAITMRNTFIQTLACVFECGPQWLMDLISQTHAVPTIDTYLVEMLLNPQLNFQHFITFPQGQTALSSLLAFLSHMIVAGIPWASGASERNFGPLIITAPSPDPAVDTSKAIVFAPFEHSRTLLIAVPEVIKDAQYHSLARGWILTSKNPYTGSTKPVVGWILQSKGVIFGDGRFNGALGTCGDVDVRNHRVYGPASD